VSWQRCREHGGIGIVGAADLDDNSGSRSVFARLWAPGAGHGDVSASSPYSILKLCHLGIGLRVDEWHGRRRNDPGDRVVGGPDSRAHEGDGLEEELDGRCKTKEKERRNRGRPGGHMTKQSDRANGCAADPRWRNTH
jgi:hypothetical protein